MFTRKPSSNRVGLEEAIDACLTRMSDLPADSDEYAKIADQLSKLYALRNIDPPARISPDTLVVVGANLLGIALIIGHERAHVVTSKALAFVMKLK